MTKLLIADDHPMIRSAVSMLLEGSEFEIIAQAGDAKEALAAVRESDPEIIILDVAMPGGSGLDVLRAIRAKGDDRAVVILTAAIDDLRLAEALSLAVDGIVMKNSDPAHLLDCLECVRQGGQWLDPDLSARTAAIAERGPPESLAPRERELVRLVAEGMRNREIAEQLGITEGTVKVYLHSIFEKLGVTSRTELAVRARRASTPEG